MDPARENSPIARLLVFLPEARHDDVGFGEVDVPDHGVFGTGAEAALAR